MLSTDSISSDVRAAWASSVFAGFPERAANALLEVARDREFGPGTVVYRGWEAHVSSPVLLIVEGLVRVYVRSDGGREITVRYLGDGEVLGLPALVSHHHNVRLAASVVAHTRMLSLPGDRLAELAVRDAGVAWPIARYLANIVHTSEELWASNVFNAMRARVAYHLLELSDRDPDGLFVRATQDELANAVGSVREVVARTLRAFGDEGLITRDARAIRLRDPAALHRVATAQENSRA